MQEYPKNLFNCQTNPNSRWLLIITPCTIKLLKTTLKSNNIKVKDTSQNPVSIHKSEININTVYNCNK